MKHLNKTVFTTALLATFALGQPVLANTPDHNEATQGISVSPGKHHANKDAIFGDDANHEGYAGGHSASDESHGAHGSHSDFTSAEHEAIEKLIFGNDSKRK